MSVDGVAGAYREVLDQRVKLMETADDPALKQHFQNEIKAIEGTIAAMSGGAAPAAPEAPSGDIPASGAAAPLEGAPDAAGGNLPVAGGGVPPVTKGNVSPDVDAAGPAGPDAIAMNAGAPVGDTPGMQPPVTAPASTGGSEGAALGPGLPAALEPYRDAIIAASEKTGVPADLIGAVAWKETRGDHDSYLSPSSAMGLMQVDPGTFNSGPDSLASRHPELSGGDLTDATTNVLAGAFELKDQFTAFGSWGAALRAYNSGAEAVNTNDLSDITSGKAAEAGRPLGTANYVDVVNEYWQIISTGNGQLVDNPEGMIPG